MSVLRVAVLVTVHNRVAVTVAGLRRLRDLSEKLCGEASFSVFLVDDSSSDGTAERVREIPMDLTVVQGTGQLYWNRGMVLAHQTALSSAREFDAYLLYNDDVLLDDHFIEFVRQYIQLGDGILVGALRDPDTGAITYSGVRRMPQRSRLRFARAQPTEPLEPVDAFNGNCVLIASTVFDALGGLDPAYTHFFGDYDLGLRAAAIGVQPLLFGLVGICPVGLPRAERIRQADLPERWRLLFRFPYTLRPEFRFVRKHSPPLLFPLRAFSVIKMRVAALLPLRHYSRRIKQDFLRSIGPSA